MQELSDDAENEPYTHADEHAFDPASLGDLIRQVGMLSCTPYVGRWLYHDRFARRELSELAAGVLRSVRPHSVAAHNLAGIRKSTASDAINAISLARIANSLRTRGIAIRSHVIPDGTPRRFVWRSLSRRFEGGSHLPAQGPTINLLGPSESLVRKHWNRLPVGVYAEVALYSFSLIKSITPSNQLSYVAHCTAEDQGILVTGDAGCVDFKLRRRQPYYEELLDALSPLHVVQVAHHAGNNAHFYRVLKAAQYPKAEPQSFLLVSHATHDRHRPSREFRQFVEDVRREPEVVSVLFTTQPRADKIRDFESLVHPPVGHPATQGDVRLEFKEGRWNVTKHAIAIVTQPAQQSGLTGQPAMALENDLSIKPPVKIVKHWKRKPL